MPAWVSGPFISLNLTFNDAGASVDLCRVVRVSETESVLHSCHNRLVASWTLHASTNPSNPTWKYHLDTFGKVSEQDVGLRLDLLLTENLGRRVR